MAIMTGGAQISNELNAYRNKAGWWNMIVLVKKWNEIFPSDFVSDLIKIDTEDNKVDVLSEME